MTVLPDTDLEAWKDRGICAQTDPEIFYPEKGGSTREAKRVCLGCDVRDQCLQYALDHDERFGIWGGLSQRERRRLKRGDLTVLKPPTPVGHCEVCDKALYSRKGGAPSRFCSESCRSRRRNHSGDHGTLAGYKAGCKCAYCCAANARYVAGTRRQQPPDRICQDQDCGAMFTPHGGARYCSVKCRTRAGTERYRRARKPESRIRECATCGTVFNGHHRAQYCSQDCHKQARRKPQVASVAQPRLIACGHCGNQFTASHHRAKYCSGSCRTKACNQRKVAAA